MTANESYNSIKTYLALSSLPAAKYHVDDRDSLWIFTMGQDCKTCDEARRWKEAILFAQGELSNLVIFLRDAAPSRIAIDAASSSDRSV